MELSALGADALKTVEEILGYLNLSSGGVDPKFLHNLNELFGVIQKKGSSETATWQQLREVLVEALKELDGTNGVFRDISQVEALLPLIFDHALPEYQRYHSDLLFHQTAETLFQPFFIGRMCEAVLQQGAPWDETDRVVGAALRRLNDYLGHRPVAVLETDQKIQPYEHEYLRPIPLYIRGAGVAYGRYYELITLALEILASTDSSLLFQAWFNLEHLDELAFDPRAYDFDHPVNKRPNYLFGQWDMTRLDNSGYSRRFVLQQVSLDAMLARVEEQQEIPYEERLYEAATVLAGTMLMGSGVSGDCVGAHDSDTNLHTLVQHIAGYRDTFYEQLLGQMSGARAKRLQKEAATLQQPFGGARQDFNQRLARRRAAQLQHVHLAQLFARMGYIDAATRQVRVVPVASARMLCDMYCHLTTSHRALEKGQGDDALAVVPKIEEVLHRAIHCGALVDPWNILGFGAQYSLFPAVENSIPDHRVDDLIDVVSEIFTLYVAIQNDAAARGEQQRQVRAAAGLERLAEWWDQFAAVEVGAIESVSGRETCESATHVATALRAWHEAGTAAGDVAFWRNHVERFRSAKAYALVVDALLDQHDVVAAMALLMQWLSQSDAIPLAEENYTFYDLTLSWMDDLWRTEAKPGEKPIPERKPSRQWQWARKFLDFLEANAEAYWKVPTFGMEGELADDSMSEDELAALEELSDDLGDEVGLFGAAYEDVTYRDSTDDGFEGEMLEGGSDLTDDALFAEAERIAERLMFLNMIAQLWKKAALASFQHRAVAKQRDDVLSAWLQQAEANRRDLSTLMTAVYRYPIPAPRGTQDALVEYDRRRAVKDGLLDQIISTCVETVDAARMIRAAMQKDRSVGSEAAWEKPANVVLRGILRGNANTVRKHWKKLLAGLEDEPLLYVALARGGHPQRIVNSRGLQLVLRRLLTYLPRLGLLQETLALLQAIHEMEMDHPVGPGAITEFDHLFEIGSKAIVRAVVVSSGSWSVDDEEADDGDRDGGGGADKGSAADDTDLDLIGYLENTTEALLGCWLRHSRGVRLSVLEAVNGDKSWRELERFIKRYGADLFTQAFMNLGNLRAILHEGPDRFLESLEEEPEAVESLRLLTELDHRISRPDAAQHLTLILEAIVENYHEYIDYNSTTTQSDRGDMLYTLLDFLRLRASYDRVAWNLHPVMLVHKVLIECGRNSAAEIWRRAVAERTADVANDHEKRFSRLVKKYGMRLPSIADRLGERFVRPLDIDRLRALVAPALDRSDDTKPAEAFAQLEEEITPFIEEAMGAGFEVPGWLDALQQEIDQAQLGMEQDEMNLDLLVDLPQVRLSASEVQAEVQGMSELSV